MGRAADSREIAGGAWQRVNLLTLKTLAAMRRLPTSSMARCESRRGNDEVLMLAPQCGEVASPKAETERGLQRNQEARRHHDRRASGAP